MAFIEKQRHGKRDYYYLVKSVRAPGNRVAKVRISLGREVPAKEKLQEYFLLLEKKASGGREYGASLLSRETTERLDDLRASMVVFNRTPTEVLPKDFLVRFTYNTNAIEGNPLTLRQTALVLMDGVSPQGVRTEDVIETFNAKDAWDFVKAYKDGLGGRFVCRVQREVTKNTSCRIQGGYRDSDVGITGSDWKPPRSARVPELLEAVFREFPAKKKSLHPIELAGWLHNRVVQIHPFTDGNGRTARLLMNWVLIRNRFPPAVIEVRSKEEYYKAIESADRGKGKPFADFLARQLLEQYTMPKGTR
jgi:Fic family protein